MVVYKKITDLIAGLLSSPSNTYHEINSNLSFTDAEVARVINELPKVKDRCDGIFIKSSSVRLKPQDGEIWYEPEGAGDHFRLNVRWSAGRKTLEAITRFMREWRDRRLIMLHMEHGRTDQPLEVWQSFFEGMGKVDLLKLQWMSWSPDIERVFFSAVAKGMPICKLEFDVRGYKMNTVRCLALSSPFCNVEEDRERNDHWEWSLARRRQYKALVVLLFKEKFSRCDGDRRIFLRVKEWLVDDSCCQKRLYCSSE